LKRIVKLGLNKSKSYKMDSVIEGDKRPFEQSLGQGSINLKSKKVAAMFRPINNKNGFL
jgi:hypothetical protein